MLISYIRLNKGSRRLENRQEGKSDPNTSLNQGLLQRPNDQEVRLTIGNYRNPSLLIHVNISEVIRDLAICGTSEIPTLSVHRANYPKESTHALLQRLVLTS